MIEWKKHLELHEFYQTLLELKHSNPALNANSEIFQLHTSCDPTVLAYLRKKDGHEVLVFLNLSDHLVRFDLLDRWITGKFREVFSHAHNNFSVERSFEMKAWEWLVFVKE